MFFLANEIQWLSTANTSRQTVTNQQFAKEVRACLRIRVFERLTDDTRQSCILQQREEVLPGLDSSSWPGKKSLTKFVQSRQTQTARNTYNGLFAVCIYTIYALAFEKT